jgi:predicted O-methyltransferase YrrM
MPPSTSFSDSPVPNPPPALEAITTDTAALGFKMASTHQTGVMLCTLAASKPDGRILELGTGTGAGTAWLLHGMNANATLDTVDNNPASVAIAKRHLGHDPRIRFHLLDGSAFLRDPAHKQFDLIFADTWPGKFTNLDAALFLLSPGGLYILDDLLPQPSWPEDHAPKIPRLIEQLTSRADLTLWPLNWDTGIVVAVKKA